MANSRWIGRAAAIPEIRTITIANTWAQNDTLTVTIGGASLVLTVGTSVATTDVAAALKAMLEGDALVGDESRTNTGDNIPQFSEFDSTVSGSVVTLTGSTDGLPFAITVTESTAGSGTATGAQSQAATGPNDVNNANNWSEGSVPGAADDVFVENTNVSLLYNLDQLSGATLTSFTVDASFTGEIGLPKTNANGYNEYRADFLEIDCSTIRIGVGDGSGSPRIKINSGTVQTAIEVIKTGGGTEDGVAALLLKGSHASNTLEVQEGSVGVAIYGGEAAQYTTVRNAGDLLMSAAVTLATVQQRGGSIQIDSNVTTLTQSGGSSTIYGTATVTTLTHTGGICDYRSSGTCTAGTVGGGREQSLLTFENDPSSRTFTDLTIKPNSMVRDPHNTLTVTNGITKHADTIEIVSG